MALRDFRRPALRAVLLLLVVAGIYYFVDLPEVVESLARASPSRMVLLIGIASLSRWLMAYKWNRLCRPFLPEVKFSRFLRIYYAASFLNYCMPTTLGGELYRGVVLSQEAGDRKQHVYASMVVEKLIGAAATIAAAWLGLFYLVTHYTTRSQQGLFTGVIVVSIGAALLVVLALHPALPLNRIPLVGRLGPTRLRPALSKFYRAYREFAEHRILLFQNLLLAVGETVVSFTLYYVAAGIVGVDAHWLDFLAITAVVQLARRTTMVLESWSLSEATAVAIYGLVGITPAVALALSLLVHASVSMACVPGGVFLLVDRRNGKKTAVSRQERAA